MLTGIRKITLSRELSIPTPVLIPSFSSKYRADIDGILHGLLPELEKTPILISAYDIHFGFVRPQGIDSDLVILDSGGYEASQDTDGLELGIKETRAWSAEQHSQVVEGWADREGSLYVTYDHPNLREPLEKQLSAATNFAARFGAAEFLIKPERLYESLDISKVVSYVSELTEFPAVGVTEKELGYSLEERLLNLAKLRRAFQETGSDTPIHVLGCLDTVTTVMLFLAGADIFDSLSWLRFAFHAGNTWYKPQFAACELDWSADDDLVEAHCWVNNHRFMQGLQNQMAAYAREANTDCFSHHRELYARVINEVLGRV